MSTKKEKCCQCSGTESAVCDRLCPCHLQSESIKNRYTRVFEWEEVQEVHSEVIKVMESIGFGLLLDGQTFYKKGYELKPYELKPREHTTFSMTQAYEIKNAITTAVAKRDAYLVDEVENMAGWNYDGTKAGNRDCPLIHREAVISIIKH